MLGRAKSVKVQKENTVIVDGCGSKEEITARVSQIKKQIQETTSEFDTEKLQEKEFLLLPYLHNFLYKRQIPYQVQARLLY